jgi:uncharacterized protein with von Willebrand factor type A (vWA) domain
MESSNGMSQGTENFSNPGVTQNVSTETQTPSERTFRQSEVNDIVKKAKYGAIEDYKRQWNEQPQYAAQKYGERDVQQPAAQVSQDEIRKLAAEEAQRLRDQWLQEAQSKAEAEHAQKTVQNFWNKLAPGKEKYSDFDKVLANVNLSKFPNVVQLLAEYVDNSADLMHYLGNDPIKMNELESLAQRSPEGAVFAARKLSQSLKDNESSAKVKVPNEPLSQLRPSNTGTDNGVMSIRDLRQKYR